MATNLRLRPDTEAALRAEAERTGRSQQDLIREAVDVALGLAPGQGPAAAARGGADARRAELLSAHGIVPARTTFAELAALVALPSEVSILDLLDRADRA